jgi:hypothetical protein
VISFPVPALNCQPLFPTLNYPAESGEPAILQAELTSDDLQLLAGNLQLKPTSDG